MLAELNAVYAVIPPVTALLESKTSERVCVAHNELGMEAFYRVKVEDYPVIIAAAKGGSIY
jgi:fumarate hydratase subunit beta